MTLLWSCTIKSLMSQCPNLTYHICDRNCTKKQTKWIGGLLHLLVNCFSNEALITEEDLEDQSYVDYDTGKYSPKLLRPNELDIDTVVYDPADDMRKLELARQQVRSTGRVRVSIRQLLSCHENTQHLVLHVDYFTSFYCDIIMARLFDWPFDCDVTIK